MPKETFVLKNAGFAIFLGLSKPTKCPRSIHVVVDCAYNARDTAIHTSPDQCLLHLTVL